MINIIRISALSTNYIWLIYNYKNECIIIDPGETTKILNILRKYQFILQAILLTHNHIDHIAGTNILTQHFPNAATYGPAETKYYNPNISSVSEGDSFTLLQQKFTVISLPGHTLGHIGFYSPPWLFCGDTVFSAGCGKVYSGLMKNMYESFLKIKSLPHNTLIFSGHEYTFANINFAISILPKDKYITNYYNKIMKLTKENKPTIPTVLGLELKINPFFRCNSLEIKQSLNFLPDFKEDWKIFAKLRKKKDLY